MSGKNVKAIKPMPIAAKMDPTIMGSLAPVYGLFLNTLKSISACNLPVFILIKNNMPMYRNYIEPHLLKGGIREMKLEIQNMGEGFASEILSWRYDPPYDFYNNEYDAETVKELLENNYSVVLNQNRKLTGFFCVGSSAQVPIGAKVGAYTEDIIDIGLGMAPALTGKGNGYTFFSFVLESLNETYGDVPVRLTVVTFNKRAIGLYEKFGFVKGIEFTTDSAKFQTMKKV